MAKKPKSSEPQVLQMADLHLRKLPLKPETWQCGIKPLVEPAMVDGRPIFHEMVLVGDHASGMLGLELIKSGKLTSDDLWRALETSMTRPKVGSPRRPMYIHKIKDPVWDDLEPRLSALKILVKNASNLPLIDHFYECFTEDVVKKSGFDEDRLPNFDFLSIPGVTPSMVESFHAMAAQFYRAEPWTKVDDSPIRIETPSFPIKSWDAMVMGQGQTIFGFAMHPKSSLNSPFPPSIMINGQGYDGVALPAIAVTFDPRETLSHKYVESIHKHGWEISSEEAYPVLVCKNANSTRLRRAQAWEMQLLEVAMHGITQFLSRFSPKPGHALISAMGAPYGRLEIEFPTTLGESHKLALSWALHN